MSKAISDDDDFDDFMRKVDLVATAVSGLKDGTMSLEEVGKVERDIGVVEAEKAQKQEVEVKARQIARAQLETPEEKEKRLNEEAKQGRSGTGLGEDVKLYCGRCKWEYTIDIEAHTCTRCGREMMTREERKENVDAMVKDMLKQKEERKARRERWEAWKKEREEKRKMGKVVVKVSGQVSGNNTEGGAKGNSLTTTYEGWDFWEPESDDDELVAPTSPEFKALEDDLRKRSEARAKKIKIAEVIKKEADEFMKQHKYRTAIKKYAECLDNHRGYKEVYLHRAICYLRLQGHVNYDLAAKDASTVLDILTYLENKNYRGSGFSSSNISSTFSSTSSSSSSSSSTSSSTSTSSTSLVVADAAALLDVISSSRVPTLVKALLIRCEAKRLLALAIAQECPIGDDTTNDNSTTESKSPSSSASTENSPDAKNNNTNSTNTAANDLSKRTNDSDDVDDDDGSSRSSNTNTATKADDLKSGKTEDKKNDKASNSTKSAKAYTSNNKDSDDSDDAGSNDVAATTDKANGEATTTSSSSSESSSSSTVPPPPPPLLRELYRRSDCLSLLHACREDVKRSLEWHKGYALFEYSQVMSAKIESDIAEVCYSCVSSPAINCMSCVYVYISM